ncbi:CdaR family transcriptional regulator [Facklamia sp. 7083-14-GEN3]|uniref:PucR family transcriptional regulator n=1 Tax=Facklamia sp. 7083-14-GEN3 TaxID=2973478 RepID=UPI00215D0A97|nr:helix-turn-helix domain-containing protein [Facklamia sp. 7083-14-GEN3]MCR8969940.1 helix-turn-helix domain-containing protein [Facklamia sp. 7083-14-GEN3]
MKARKVIQIPHSLLNLDVSHKEGYCLFHIFFEHLQTDFEQALWLSTLRSSSQNIIDYIKLNSHHYVYVIHNSFWTNQGSQIMEGILKMLNDDFGQSALVIIGSPYTGVESVEDQISFDLAQIESHYWLLKKNTINRMSHLLLQQVGKNLQESALAQFSNYSQMISDEEDRALIRQLFLNGGNISKTAQDLYLHRNTLNYRIDRLNKSSGLNLRLISDLTLLYLLIC